MGLGLVLVLLFLFLNARTAFWVAVGIPVSMLTAVALMYAFGLTLNMISLFALIITLGIVVDDAIVVGEHADFRARHRGEDPVTAAENAARRMFPPVFSATLTTIIAFFGLTAIGGRFGDLIADIPFTVIAVLIASLVECFLILPNHMAHALTPFEGAPLVRLAVAAGEQGLSLGARTAVPPADGAGDLGALPGARRGDRACSRRQAALFIAGDVRFRFFNAPERSDVTGQFRDGARGHPRRHRRDAADAARGGARPTAPSWKPRHGTNPITYVLARSAATPGAGLPSADDKDADLLGAISIELIDADLRPYSSFTFVSEIAGPGAAPPAARGAELPRRPVRPGRRCARRRAHRRRRRGAEGRRRSAEDRRRAVPEVSARGRQPGLRQGSSWCSN